MATDDQLGYGIETLLNLHGWATEVGGRFWISTIAFRVPSDESRPHGINYSLTMHRPGGSKSWAMTMRSTEDWEWASCKVTAETE